MSAILILVKGDDDGGLDLTDGQAGSLGSAFIVGYVIASPIYAHWTQFYNPMWLVLSGMSIFTFASFISGFSYAFWMLLIGRMLSGFGEAAIIPIGPTIVQDIAPRGKDSVWISTYMIAAPMGIAIADFTGYNIAHLLGDWRYVFIFQGLIMVVLISIGIFNYKNLHVDVKKEKREEQLLNASVVDTEPERSNQALPFCSQMKELFSNSLFMFLSFGYAAMAFTFGGFGFWSLDFCEEYYDTDPAVVSIVFGANALIAGSIATPVGGIILGRMLRPHVQDRIDWKITEEKLTQFKAELASRVCFWAISFAACFLIVAGMMMSFLMFFIFYAIGIMGLLVSIGTMYMGFMSSCEEHLRGQSMAIAQLISHAGGDVVAPYAIGILIQFEGYRFAIMVAFCWLLWGSLSWWLARTIARTHGAGFWKSLSVAFTSNPREALEGKKDKSAALENIE